MEIKIEVKEINIEVAITDCKCSKRNNEEPKEDNAQIYKDLISPDIESFEEFFSMVEKFARELYGE